MSTDVFQNVLVAYNIIRPTDRKLSLEIIFDYLITDKAFKKYLEDSSAYATILDDILSLYWPNEYTADRYLEEIKLCVTNAVLLKYVKKCITYYICLVRRQDAYYRFYIRQTEFSSLKKYRHEFYVEGNYIGVVGDITLLDNPSDAILNMIDLFKSVGMKYSQAEEAIC